MAVRFPVALRGFRGLARILPALATTFLAVPGAALPPVAGGGVEGGADGPGTEAAFIDAGGHVVRLDPLPPDLPGLAAYRTDDPRRPLRLGDGLLVRFRQPTWDVPPDLASAAGVTAQRSIDRARTTWRCRANGPEGVLRASRILANRPGVLWALPDFVVPVDLHGAPDDPWYPRQWAFRPGGSGTIDAEGAWALTTGDARVVAAVVDTGVDTLHPDLGPGRFVPGWDALDGDPDPGPGPLAAGAHGTHCAGILGALHNDRGVAGICPGCRLMGVRFLTGLPGDEHVTELSNAAEALHRAADGGAWVIGNSWGVFNVNKPKIPMEPLREAAVYAATHGGPDGQGALVVFSSGNQTAWDESTQRALALPIAQDDLAALPEVISVGATDPDDVRQEYSQFGPELDLVAPGGSLVASRPQIVTLDTSGSAGGQGNGANKGNGAHYVSALLLEVRKDGLPETDATGEVTEYFNGTSSSAPMVAGVAALVWSADLADGTRDLSAGDVRRILEGTADRVGALPYADGRNEEYGHGRLNAGRAVRAARYGVDGAPGDRCIVDVNCAGGVCAREAGAAEGACGGLLPDPGPPDGPAGTDSSPPDDAAVPADAPEDAKEDRPGPDPGIGDPAGDLRGDPAEASIDRGKGGCGAGRRAPAPCTWPLGLFVTAAWLIRLAARRR